MFRSFLYTLALLTTFIIPLGTCQATYDGPEGKYHTWFSDQMNDHGQVCCDEADGRPYLGDYKFNKDGSVTLQDGRKVEPWQVLKKGNPTGNPILWIWNGKIRCFAPGSLT